MFYVLQNESTADRRRVPILLTDAATGTTAQTGIAITNIYPYVNINGGAFAGGAGTIAEAGFGQYYYQFDVAEIATLGLAGIHITAAGCRDYDAISQVAALDFYSASAGSALTAYDVWAFDYLNAGVVPVSAAERLEETRTNTYTIDGNTTNIADQVWNLQISGYSDPSAGFNLYQLGIGATGYAGISITAGDVWEYDISAISTAGTAGSQLNLAALPSGAGISAGDVWSYATRTITGGIADTVTTLTDRSGFAITGGTITTVSDKTGYSLSGSQTFNLTGNITGNLSGSVGSVTGAVGSVTGNVGGNVTGSVASVVGNVGGNVVGSVASVTSDVNVSTASMSGIAGTVWSYATRTITGGIADTVTSVTNGVTVTTNNDKTGYALSGTQSFNLTGNITGNLSGSVGSVTGAVGSVTGAVGSVTGSVGSVVGSVASVTNPVTFDSAQYAGIASSVWNAATRTLTSAGAGISAYEVWNFVLSDSNTAEVDLVQAAAGSGLTAGDVWSAPSRTITGGIADTVTTVTDRSGFAITGGTITTVSDKTGYSLSGTQSFNLTGNITGNLSGSVGSITGNVGGNVVGSVASVTNPVTFDSAQYAGIASSVWNAATRTLTSGGSGISAYDVWNFNTRTITGGIADTVTTLTNKSGFAITGGTIDVVNDKTGYSLSGTQTFNVTGNVTGNVSGSVGSVTGAVGSVAGNVAGNVVGSVTSVTNPVTFNSAQYAGIASSVWNAGTRTLTSGGSGISAFDVWNYSPRSLTSGAGITVSAATNIINGPYFVKSNVDGQDGTLDVIRDMVQDIQLSVTDAFQNPFDLTSLGMAVNFYDQAGTLVTSYGTSSLYAPGGLIQFTLDTAVTANEGRYNLILSAAGSGNTIKFGPLQTLVRPF